MRREEEKRAASHGIRRLCCRGGKSKLRIGGFVISWSEHGRTCLDRSYSNNVSCGVVLSDGSAEST